MSQHLRAMQRLRFRGVFLFLPAVGLVVACGGGDDEPRDPGTGVDPNTVTVAVASGNDQSGPAGGRLAQPLAVAVRGPDGAPARDITIRFRRVSGTVTLLDTLAVSDFDGTARGTVLLGTTTGAARISAEVLQAPTRAVTFDLTVSPPPTIAALSPATFGPGDTIRVTGTGFALLGTSPGVLFAGERGTLVPGSITATELRAVVPPCVPAGPVQVRLQANELQTAPVDGTAATRNAPLRLAEFEAVTLPAARAASCLAFAGNARYALLPSFAATRDFAVGRSRDSVPSFPYVIGASGTPTPQVIGQRPPRTDDPAAAFHLFLRWQERQIASEAASAYRQARVTDGVSLSLARADLPAVGSTRQFQVLNSLTASPATYATVTARLVYAGSNILLYVDQATPTPPSGVADTTYARLGVQFNDDLFPIDARTFGAPTDIDGNGRTLVLFTPVVNRLTSDRAGCGSYIAGFFNGIDLVATSSRGNRGEIFYGSVPGAQISSQANCLLTIANWNRATPATFIHELQHLISFGQHVLRRNGESEDVWLNEGLSHIAEELGGRLYEQRFPAPADRTDPAQLFPNSAQGFLPPNFSNAYDFFSSRTEYSLTSPTEFGTLEERGVAWLFLRWLGDLRGEQLYGQLVQTNRTGTANVEAVSGEPFTRLFADFATAVLLDNFPGADTTRINPRYQIRSRNLRAIYARLNAIDRTNFPRPYPLELADLPAAQRLTAGGSFTGSLKPGAFDLFELRLTGGAANASFRAPTGSFQSDLNAQLTVVRMP